MKKLQNISTYNFSVPHHLKNSNDQLYSFIFPFIQLQLNNFEQWSLGCTVFFHGKGEFK
ncbi:unnamed protein product [Meloidogyne enterolobii]|uniref:Uncharacterized protein n=1 Tax=Meloidogyne enterolobii TaxID=390850 RepID=A0ACB0YAB1_MELEN